MLGMDFGGEASSTTTPAPGSATGGLWENEGRPGRAQGSGGKARPARGLASTNQAALNASPSPANTAPSPPIVTTLAKATGRPIFAWSR